MEYFKLKIKKNKYNEKLEELSLFKWEEKEKRDIGNAYKCVFSRDETIANYNEIVNLEQKYLNLKTPEIVSVIIFIASSIVLLTIFLISFLTNKTSNHTLDFLCFLLPALILFISGSVLMLFKSKKILYLLNHGEQDKKDILKKVKEL